MLTKVGVNMGDHAQDVVRAVEVSPDETVQEMANRVLSVDKWVPQGPVGFDYQYDWYLIVRLVEPAP
jgi:hypothetical protein